MQDLSAIKPWAAGTKNNPHAQAYRISPGIFIAPFLSGTFFAYL
jgi:hypothetical protein